jgi:hypothetical protein
MKVYQQSDVLKNKRMKKSVRRHYADSPVVIKRSVYGM